MGAEESPRDPLPDCRMGIPVHDHCFGVREGGVFHEGDA